MPSSTQLPIAAIVTSIFYLKFSSSAVTSKSTEVLNVDSSITLTHTFNVASCGVYVVTSIEKEVERRRSTPATLTWRRTRRPSVPPKVPLNEQLVLDKGCSKNKLPKSKSPKSLFFASFSTHSASLWFFSSKLPRASVQLHIRVRRAAVGRILCVLASMLALHVGTTSFTASTMGRSMTQHRVVRHRSSGVCLLSQPPQCSS